MAGKFSIVYRESGRVQETLDLELEDLKWKRVLYQADHEARLITMSHVGDLYCLMGRHQQAVELREAVLSVLRDTMEVDSPPILSMMCAVAHSYIDLGDVRKGMDKSVEAYTACERVTGKDSQQKITAFGLVSSINVLKGDLQEAARTGEVVLKMAKKV
jgi:hypothetical protein